MNSARIDVLIPVYNGARWLRESIASIQAQTHAAITIHVVDDGSTDATPAILDELRLADPRLCIHRQANGGIVDALNHGLGFCTAEWVARHDADDLADPRRFERQIAYLLAHPDCVAVGAIARHIDAQGRELGTVTELRPPEEADATWAPAREPYLMHPFVMARRSALMAVGGYRHASHAEDSDLYWRLHQIGRLHNLPEVLGAYRLHDDSISSGSVVNGRRMAIGSQRAALSSRRRRAGKADLAFDRIHRFLASQPVTLRQMVHAAEVELEPSERPLFELAVVAKLLELASYLPYEPDTDDCTFIAKTMRVHRKRVSPANRRALASQCARTAVRLWLAGRPGDALRLLHYASVDEFLARLAWTGAVKQQLGRLRRWARRAMPRMA
jgi:glycosyltransferase involved in cell wall biosynthesis